MAGRRPRGRSERVGDVHARVMMRIIHTVTARNAERGTIDLSVRERLAIQRLGMDGELAITALGHRLGVSPSSMTSLVDRLEERRYVRRVAHATDRRATVLRLTNRGRDAFAREIDFYRSLIDETLQHLGDETTGPVLRTLESLQQPDADEDAA